MNRLKHFPPYRWLIRQLCYYFPVTITKFRYKLRFGSFPNLRSPQDLNEKILWLSLYSDTTKWSKLADKYAVRGYLKEKGLDDHLVKLYSKWNSPDEIDWNFLPESFVLKTNNGCGTVFIVKNKDEVDESKIKKELKQWLDKPYGVETIETHYTRIKPCIIAEELLYPEKQSSKSSSMIDYKFWCINGEPLYCWCIYDRNKDGKKCALNDLEWNAHPENIVSSPAFNCEGNLQRPKNFDEMIEVARKLSEGFPVVRVDLYETTDGVYFGEMTFTAHGGNIDYLTPEFKRQIGKRIDLSNTPKKGVNRPVRHLV